MDIKQSLILELEAIREDVNNLYGDINKKILAIDKNASLYSPIDKEINTILTQIEKWDIETISALDSIFHYKQLQSEMYMRDEEQQEEYEQNMAEMKTNTQTNFDVGDDWVEDIDDDDIEKMEMLITAINNYKKLDN